MPRKKVPIMPVEERTWYTIEEAAGRLAISTTHLSRHVQAGAIKCIILPLSKKRVFDKGMIEQLRREEYGIIDDPPVRWPGDTRSVPPGVQLTTTLSRG